MWCSGVCSSEICITAGVQTWSNRFPRGREVGGGSKIHLSVIDSTRTSYINEPLLCACGEVTFFEMPWMRMATCAPGAHVTLCGIRFGNRFFECRSVVVHPESSFQKSEFLDNIQYLILIIKNRVIH